MAFFHPHYFASTWNIFPFPPLGMAALTVDPVDLRGPEPRRAQQRRHRGEEQKVLQAAEGSLDRNFQNWRSSFWSKIDLCV